MKIFAFYLPQFHRIPENDKWWGEGFTEWTNVRKAKKITKTQQQPKVPLDGNYYNLLDKKTMKWQTCLANSYHIDGFIYYHYYFQGKKLLEKPAEELLKDKSLNQRFFFCWANHSWNRSWKGSKEVLIEQTYGSKEDWENHFQYLLPFFLDDRYEKKDNKPLFMLFKSVFPEKNELIAYFDKRCKENGFDGICCFETCPSPNSASYKVFKDNIQETSYVFYREPGLGLFFERERQKNNYFKKIKSFLSKRGFGSFVWTYEGDKCLLNSMNYRKEFSKYAPGLFFEWDNTPRHGKRGYIITPVSRDMFLKYMDTIKNCEFLFINAWNEWCEGMILEPTVDNGYKYLDWINEWRQKIGD